MKIRFSELRKGDVLADGTPVLTDARRMHNILPIGHWFVMIGFGHNRTRALSTHPNKRVKILPR